jgi:16S rRNA (guanine527-N7)-methyltransferase
VIRESGLEELLRNSGIEARSCEADRMRAFVALLRRWNTRVNLVGSLEWEVLGRLLGEALWAGGLLPVGAARHLDIGSGAGFPALPMAIRRPESLFDLVESRERRAVFLETAVSSLGLANVRVVPARIEDFLRGTAARYDRVSWKALRLSKRAGAMLLDRTHEEVAFWLFHGKDLPCEDSSWWEAHMKLLRCAGSPAGGGWQMSIYGRKQRAPVSRETG